MQPLNWRPCGLPGLAARQGLPGLPEILAARMCLCLQDTNVQVTNDLSESKKELEQLRVEAAKKAKKKGKNSRSIGSQCELSYGEDATPVSSSCVSRTQHMRGPSVEVDLRAAAIDQSTGRVVPAVMRHTAPQVRAHCGRVVPAVMRHTAPHVHAHCVHTEVCYLKWHLQ